MDYNKFGVLYFHSWIGYHSIPLFILSYNKQPTLSSSVILNPVPLQPSGVITVYLQLEINYTNINKKFQSPITF